MKKFNLFSILIFCTLIIYSCQKDDFGEKENTPDAITKIEKLNWSETEKQFFSIDNETSIAIRNDREGQTENSNLIIDPFLIEGINYLSNLNEKNQFVKSITQKVGYPLWREVLINNNDSKALKIMVIPFAFAQEAKTTAVFTLLKKDGRFIFDGYARDHLMADLEECQNGHLSEHLIGFDERIFSLEDEVLKSKFENCDCIFNKPPDVDDCEWIAIELCTDDQTQSGWAPSLISTLSPVFDHDRDGIHNSEDQDFYEWSARHNVTQQDLIDGWNEFWQDNYADQYGSWDDFYDDYGYDYDQWDYYADLMMDIYYDWYDWYQEQQDYDYPFWDPRYDDPYDNDRDCPWGDEGHGINNTSEISTRNIRCEWYYVLSCNGAINGDLSTWWTGVFDDIIPCPLCSDDQELEDEERLKRLYFDFYMQDRINSNQYLSEFRNYLSSIYLECPALVGVDVFNDCLDSKLLEHIIEIHGHNENNFDDIVNLTNLDKKFGLTDDEINSIKDNFDFTTDKVILSSLKLDWDTANDQQKISQAYFCVGLIYQLYEIWNVTQPVYYSIHDFYNGAVGTALLIIDANIDLSTLGPNRKINGSFVVVRGSTLNINEIYDPVTFNWNGYETDGTTGANSKHFFFPKQGSNDWRFSIMDFNIPKNQWDVFNFR